MVLHQQAPDVTLYTSNGVICDKYNIGKYNISHRPEEGTFFVMVRACLSLENILFFIAFKELSVI